MPVSVINKHKDKDPAAVYCGRPSPLGNPFVMGKHGTREECVSQYATWLDERLADKSSPQRKLMVALFKRHKAGEEIRLACWCAPLACHCDIIRDKLLARPAA